MRHLAPAAAPMRADLAGLARLFGGLRLTILFLAVFSGALVLIDVVYNVLAVAAIGLFVLGGLRIERRNMPIILALILFNLAGLLALQPHLSFEFGVEFMIGTAFVGTTAIFFALLLNENPLQRLAVIKWASICGALVAAGAGIIGYADIAGLGDTFALFGRASGTFRDPNVLGPFLVMPLLYLASDVLRGEPGRLWKLMLAVPIALGLLLTFSRGAWGGFSVGLLLLLGFLLATAPSSALRRRIMALGAAFILLIMLLIAAALTVDEVAELLRDRFTIAKEYDSGPSGRFGSQFRSIPELAERPLGFGPNRFWLYFPENPHNAYINAFSSYGWIGGFVFLGFIAATFAAGLSAALRSGPLQAHAIVIFASLVPHLLQNLQIDTDRWRHLFMLYGLTWGIAAASRRLAGPPQASASARPATGAMAPVRLIRLS